MDIRELDAKLKGITVTYYAYWKEIEGRYTSETSLFIGKIKIASYGYNTNRSKDAVNDQYRVTSTLPGINPKLGTYATVTECEARCIGVAIHFLKMLGHNI